MELPLFGREKSWRLVRPKRVALWEWLRAIRHNLSREWLLIMDHMHQIAETKLGPLRAVAHRETPPEPITENLPPARFWTFLSARRMADALRQVWSHIRQLGIGARWWPFIFIVGLLIGIGCKWWAEDFLTIGYDDYHLPKTEHLYDLNVIETKLRSGLLPTNTPPTNTYPSCTLQ